MSRSAGRLHLKLKVISRWVECNHICLEEEKNIPVLSESQRVKGGGMEEGGGKIRAVEQKLGGWE